MLHRLFFCLLLLSATSIFAQSCPECRYTSYVFDSVVSTDVQFGSGENADGNQQDLFMTVYEPYGDTATQRPVMVFAFGGGFVQGDRMEGYVVRGCERFAKAGYVCAAIDYRIGFSIPGLFPNPTEELMRVFFRAMQDMRGAVQYLRAHADILGNSFRIDPNRILIGGASAGGITALMVAHCDKASEFAEIGDTAAIAGLGGFSSTSGLYPSYSWEPLGTFNIAGGIVDAKWIETGDPPMVNSHGDEDLTVPYMGGNLDFGFTQVGLEGSYNVQQEAESKGVCAFLHTMEGEDHPSGSASEAYFDEIFNRAMPRLGALVRGQTYCCSLDVELTPTGVIQTDANTPLNLNATVSDDQGNAVVHWCEAPCGVYHVGSDFPFAASALPEHVLAIVTEGNCMNTDFVGVEALPVGAEEVVALESSIEVFPVPTAADVTLRGLKTVMRAKLFDTKGRLCRDFGQVREGTVLDMRDLPAGIYGLQLEGKMGTVAKKLVVRYDATR